MPLFNVIAGSNGSGKSAVTRRLLGLNTETLIDPDKIARELNSFNPSKAAIAAAREAITRSRRFLANKVTFSTETTLAGNGPLALFQEAKDSGFRTNLVFVYLRNPLVNVQRVQLRVAEGGYNVPDTDILRRYDRSFANLPTAIRLVDSATMLDNSGADYVRVLRPRAGRIIWRTPSSSDLLDRLASQLS